MWSDYGTQQYVVFLFQLKLIWCLTHTMLQSARQAYRLHTKLIRLLTGGSGWDAVEGLFYCRRDCVAGAVLAIFFDCLVPAAAG